MGDRVQCRQCGGYGYIGDRENTCPTCNGVGEIRLEYSDNDYVQCRPCGGYGYIGNREDTCPTCNGTGRLLPP